MSDRLVLAVDHGTSGVKTALISTRGNCLAAEFQPVPTRFLPPGGAEQDPEDWWQGLLATTRRLLAKHPTAREQIIAAAVSSTFSSTVAVGPDGLHLGPSLTWMDSRGAPYVKAVVSGFPSVDGYNLFAMLPWIYKTGGGPQLSGKDDAAHVLWWKHERPELYAQTRYFLGSKDYLNLRLTGRAAASFDSVQLFWVTDTRDVNHIRYDDGLIRKLGLDREKFPPLLGATDLLGPLSPAAADILGLPTSVQVAAGSPDHQSAGIGSGAVGDFQAHLYLGTSSWIQCLVPFKKTDPFHSIASFPTAVPGKYYCVNEQDVAGGALTFFVNAFLFPQNPLRPEAPPEDVFARLDDLAASAPPGSSRVIFTPWLNGERTPVDDAAVRAGLHNLSLSTTPAQIARAVLEGVAFNNRWALGYVEKFCGRQLDPLHAVGGGAQSALWCQIFADVLGRTVRQVKDPLRANARGAALIAAVALGEISFAEVPGLVAIERTFTPDPGRRKIYDELFREFLALYKNNRAMYRRLNRIR